MEVENIVIVLTPFQKYMIGSVDKNLFDLETTLVFHSKHVSFENCNCKTERINGFEFSKRRLFRLDLSYFKEAKHAIQRIRGEISEYQTQYSLTNGLNVFIGSEKDVFSQMLLATPSVNLKISNLIAVEEGIGYYKTGRTFNTQLTKIAYKLLTPILFGERIDYVYTLGLDPRIKIVYARMPKLLPKKRKGVEYLQLLGPARKGKRIYSASTKKILIYSFPSEDYGMKDHEKKNIFKILINAFPQKQIVIKPHPRENVDLFNNEIRNNNVTLLDKGFIGEGIDYFEFEKIINFSSSVVIDILMAGYPKEEIYTIFFDKSPKISFLKETKCLKLANLNMKNFED
ncbi:glycosyltransferase family 52 [Flagellimonas marina]|jgi:hypothetical protein|uniref:Glycosyltransferase family 52 n=1 Tax=Flagellimonas marina TaxID=1775168 RepID=A0ABV8PNI3_9FLAO